MNHQKGVTFISKHSQLATGGGVMRDEGRTKNTEMWEKMERKGESERKMVMT